MLKMAFISYKMLIVDGIHDNINKIFLFRSDKLKYSNFKNRMPLKKRRLIDV